MTLVVHVDAEAELSGGEVQTFLLMEGLRRAGIDNLLVCPPGAEAEAEAARRGFPVERVRMRNDLDVAAVLRMRRVFARRRADLVQLHTGRATWLGGFAAALARVPAVTTRRMDRRVARGWKARLVYHGLVEHVVAISPAVRDHLLAAGVPPDRVTVVWDGVDPDELAERRAVRDLRAEAGLTRGDLVVLVLAALVPRKGIDVLLEALRLLAADGVRPHVWIAGRGPERDALVAARDEAGLDRVRFLGWRSDKPDLLRAADCLVLPSRREGVGVAALEAMAAGVPVVATRVGGLGQAVVDGATGLLCGPGDARSLACALERVLASSDLRARLGGNGRRHVRGNLSAEHMVASYRRLYDRVLAASDRGRAARPLRRPGRGAAASSGRHERRRRPF